MGKVSRFIRRYYAPFLLRPVVKGVVLLFFAGTFVASVISMQYIQLGFGESTSFLPFTTYSVYP
jgi:Niemann-Pick C1 protein